MPALLPPALRGTGIELPRVLTADAARRLGMSASAVGHAIDRYGWQRLSRGALLTAPGPPTRADWAEVGFAAAGKTAALSGWDAVRIRGLGAPTPPTSDVLILARNGENRRVGRAHIRPTRRPYSITTVAVEHPELPLAPIVSVVRAVADTALLYETVAPARALVTSAVQKGLCTPDQLAVELDQGPRNGSWALRRAIEDVLDGARSIAEAEAVDLLRQARVAAFEVNVPIVDGAGVEIYVADVLWRGLRAVAEIDSREYHLGEFEWKRTMRRHNRLTAARIAVTHFPPSDIRSRRLDWAAEVDRWLRARAAEIGVAYVRGAGPIRPSGARPAPFALPPLPQ